MEQKEVNNLPKLGGTNFVRMFKDYILTLIKEGKYTEGDIKRKAYLNKDVKPTTTGKYLKDMLELDILLKDKETDVLTTNKEYV